MPKARLTLADRLAALKPAAALARARLLQPEGETLRAVKLFAVAAAAGLTVAERELGRCYLLGEAVPRNLSETARWFGRAAEKGDNDARRCLAGLAMAGHRESGIDAALFHQESAAPDFATALRWALLAAEDDVEAQVMAGFIYAAGPEALRDAARAKFWYGKAAEAGAARGHLGFGVILLHGAKTDADTFAAIAHIRRAADENLPTAQYYLGLIYEKAIGVLPDPTLAATYYGLAAQGGIITAQAKYGAMLFRGQGLKANRVQGESWLRRAGLAGDIEAAVTIAQLYASGSELPPNYAEAALWFRRAAEAGHGDSARALGVLYMTGAGVGRDADEAATWFRRAAEAGDEKAQADLAAVLLSGRTSAQLTGAAPVHEWFERAAEAGDMIGAFNFAVCLAEGVGVPKDEARAAAWFRRAAEKVVNARYWYGVMLAEGRGVAPDPTEARTWLSQAADLNFAPALVALAELHLHGTGGPRDHDAARLLYERAAKGSHVGAMFSLGALHGGGHDIPTNPVEALFWYRAAAARGHPMAALMLGKYLVRGIATEPDATAARVWLLRAQQGGVDVSAELARLDADTLPDPA
jgi:hypothetical protein